MHCWFQHVWLIAFTPGLLCGTYCQTNSNCCGLLMSCRADADMHIRPAPASPSVNSAPPGVGEEYAMYASVNIFNRTAPCSGGIKRSTVQGPAGHRERGLFLKRMRHSISCNSPCLEMVSQLKESFHTINGCFALHVCAECNGIRFSIKVEVLLPRLRRQNQSTSMLCRLAVVLYMLQAT